jgi:GPH family glycoside/pentoside/hexuronide:cation symporter
MPASLAGTAQIVYIFVSYNLMTTICFTAITVPFNSLNSLITTDQLERGINSILGMTVSTIFQLLINVFMLRLCTFLGGGELYSGKGWSAAVGVLAIIFGICILTTFLVCKEMEVTPKVKTAPKEEQVNVLHVVKMLVKNKYWVEYVLGLVSVTMSSSIVMGSAVYYAQYVLGDPYVYGSLSTALYIAMFIGVISTSLFIKKFGKRNTALIGIVILIAGTVVGGLLPHTELITTVTLAVRGFGVGFPSALGAAMLQDSLTYGRWKNGVSMVGMGNAASSFTAKVAGGLGTAIIGWVLSLGGFDSMLAVQTEAAKAAITSLFFWVPLVIICVAFVCFWLYKLDKEYNGYLADLNNGIYGPNAIVPSAPKSAEAEGDEAEGTETQGADREGD